MDNNLIELSLGDGAILTNPFGYNALLSFAKKCDEIYEERILVDFGNLEWFDANMTALLGGIIQRNKRSNGNLFLADENKFPTRFQVLRENGFIGSDVGKNYNSINFKVFGIDEDEEFMDYIYNNLLSHNSLKMNDFEKDLLASHYAEIFSNVEKHANTAEPLISCGQYYPQNKKLRFSLIDLGVGYFEPIRKYTQEMEEINKVNKPEEAIYWALRGYNTTKEIGGIGLKDLHDYCIENNNIFQIISDGCFWTSSSNQITKVRYFPGSMVNVIINCT